MKLIRGPRPLAIRVFAAAFLAAALLRLVRGLNDLALSETILAVNVPWFAWDRDWTIVALSAEFTIALIPLTWIYLFAAPFARWLVLGRIAYSDGSEGVLLLSRSPRALFRGLYEDRGKVLLGLAGIIVILVVLKPF